MERCAISLIMIFLFKCVSADGNVTATMYETGIENPNVTHIDPDVYIAQLGNVELSLELQPRKIQALEEDDTQAVTINIKLRRIGNTTIGGEYSSYSPIQGHGLNSWSNYNKNLAAVIYVKLEDTDIAQLQSNNDTLSKTDTLAFNVSLSDTQDFRVSHMFYVRGIFLGRTALRFHLKSPETISDASEGIKQANVSEEINGYYHIAVIRPVRWLDNLFIVSVTAFVFAANVGMGCKVDLDVVVNVLKRPLAPIVGFLSQFGCMPLVAYGVCQMFGLSGGLGLGMFTTGCAPGGGASNMYTYLFNGDVSLSVTMTLVSVTASLAMIPLWLFTLGQSFLKSNIEQDIRIPYWNILASLVGILLPVALGLLIQRKRPAWAKKILKILKPLFLGFIIYMMTVGLYTNIYLFKLITPSLMLAGCLLPYVGFLVGGLASIVTCQPLERKIAIAIETGLQNTGIPIMLMKYSLPQPDADLSIVSPVAVAMFTPLPLLVILIIYEVYKRCSKKRKEKPLDDIGIDNPVSKETNTESV